jgi:iron complex outermembrane recepter protein
MNKIIQFAVALIFMSAFALYGQSYSIKGKVIDVASYDAIVGAVVNIADGKGTVTDIDGNYILKVDAGNYTLNCNYVGYEAQKQKISVNGDKNLDFKLTTKTLSEVEIIADVAKIRETPVAVSTISITKIQEELAGRDISMIANTTPGVYASESGGGSGDSRVTIRGVDQRNIAVLVDGVPVNDMENGAVFWSNWDGLAEVTRTIQVQRGLGASKLAIPSLGGTMNIITRGIDQKEAFQFKYELGTRNQTRIGIGYSNTFLNKKLGITIAATRKTGEAFARETFIDAWSYFFKIQYRPHSKHLISFGFNGAPQQHGQRLTNISIAKYDTAYAKSIGYESDSLKKYNGNIAYTNYGKAYNPGWGNLKDGTQQTNINYYHKPLLNLNYTYSISPSITLNSLAYASFGDGGGTSMVGANASLAANQEQFDFDFIFKANRATNRVVKKYSETDYWSSTYIRSSINNHRWFGGLVSLSAKLNESLTFLGGLDARYYRGIHYRTPYNMIGGGYTIDNAASFNRNVFSNGNLNNFPANIDKTEALQSMVRRVGDKIEYHYDGFVKWGGAFGQLEFKKDKLSAFATASFAQTEYQRVDYFAKKDVNINGEWQEQLIGYGDTAYAYNGEIKVFRSNMQNANSPSSAYSIANGFIRFTTSSKKDSINLNAEKFTIESANARYSTSNTRKFPGYTLKAGVNYNLTDLQNVFANVGYLTIAPRFNNVYTNSNRTVDGADVQKILAADLGYSFRSRPLSANINAYYTDWKNRPTNPIVNPDGATATLNGINVLLMGVELDMSAVIDKYVDIEGSASYGDWKYTSNTTAFAIDANNVLTDTIQVFAKGVNVGDAAQEVYSLAIKFKPTKGLYIKPRWSYFKRHYANIDPGTLNNEIAENRDSWRIPDYQLVDLNMGYEFPLQGCRFTIFGNINNLLDKTFITDARNGANYDVYTSTVYIGAGRRYNIGIKVNF